LRPRDLILYRFTSEALARLCSLAVMLLAVRRLTQPEFGVFALALTAGWILAVAGDLGLQIYLAREVAWAPGAARGLLRSLLKVRLAWTALLLVPAAAATLTLGGGSSGAVILILLTQAGISCLDFLNHFYRGLSRTEIESTVNLGHRLLALAAVWGALSLQPGLDALAAALFCSMLVALAASGWTAARVSAPAAGADSGPILSWLEVARSVLPIGMGIVLSELYFRVDLFLVEGWLGVGLVALYAAVFRLFEASRLLPAAVMAVMFPRLCRQREGGPAAGLALRLGLWGAGAAAAGWWAAPWLIDLLLGEAYRPALAAFRVLLAGIPLLYANSVLTHQLIAWKREKAFAWGCAGGLVTNLGCNFLLIPLWGIEGAALSTALTEAVLLAGWIWMLKRFRGPGSGGEPVSVAVEKHGG
jgi:O-antigen/teichoic acid export membrane protein